jgi:hypothetical protein
MSVGGVRARLHVPRCYQCARSARGLARSEQSAGGSSLTRTTRRSCLRGTFFTFSGPVELPDTALTPGTYMFRLLAPNNDHSFVQVVSADGKEIYELFFTLPVPT